MTATSLARNLLVLLGTAALCSDVFAGGNVSIHWDNDGLNGAPVSPLFADQGGTTKLSAGATNIAGDGALIQLVALQGGTNYILATASVGDNPNSVSPSFKGMFELATVVASNVLEGAVGSPMAVVFYNAMTTNTATKFGVVSNSTVTVPTPDWVSPPLPITFELDFADANFQGARTTAGGGFYTDVTIGSGVDFTAVAGTYNGLVRSDPPSNTGSGFFKLMVNALGAFTGRIIIGGKSFTFSGQFDDTGSATVMVPQSTLVLDLHLDLSGGAPQITGTVTGGGFTSDLSADKSVFTTTNPPPQVGRYTLTFTPESALTGSGFGTATVASNGLIRLSGVLADGTRMGQTAPISASGTWPFFVPLFKGKGSISGVLTFTNVAGASDISGTLFWSKPPIPTARFYPSGFTTDVAVVGSVYVAPPRGTSVIAVSNATCNAELSFDDGNLVSNFTKQVTLTATNKILVCTNSADRLKMKINSKLGSFSGTFVNPDTLKLSKFRGVVLQIQDAGSGFFLGTNASGSVGFEPIP